MPIHPNRTPTGALAMIRIDAAAPSTYLNSRAAWDARHDWAQSERPGSTWSVVVTIGTTEALRIDGFATHGEAVAAMYAARPLDFTVVTHMDAARTMWDVYESTPPRPGYGIGRKDDVVVGSAMVVLVDAESPGGMPRTIVAASQRVWAAMQRVGQAISALIARTRVGRVFQAVMAVATRYIPWLAVVFAACLVIPGPFDEIGAMIVVAVYAAFKPAMRADLRIAFRTK